MQANQKETFFGGKGTITKGPHAGESGTILRHPHSDKCRIWADGNGFVSRGTELIVLIERVLVLK